MVGKGLGFSAAGCSGTFVWTPPGEPPRTVGGTWSASSEVLTPNVTGDFAGQMEFDKALTGDTLRLAGLAHLDFDVDRNGEDEEATLSMILWRQ
jgi:hypothetical protein